MRREPRRLVEHVYDVLVIGGGIYGATVAREAALRGLSVCLVDKGDFACATSANTMKIIHGGLRYLQHGDYRRVRDSIRERRTLLRIAPHLVRPLPVLVPTYGHGWRGREILGAALLLNDLCGLDRNVGLSAAHRIPRGRTISRRECQELLPDLDPRELTGAALFHDAQVENSERLLLAFLHSAVTAGAVLANYVEAVGVLRDGRRVAGAVVMDRLSAERLEIRARTTVNAAGPWADHVVRLAGGAPGLRTRLAKAVNVVTRRLFPSCAVGLSSAAEYRDHDVWVPRGSRLLFIVPWREYSIVGTWYAPHDGAPEDFRVTEQDVSRLLDDLNAAYPPAKLALDDVRFVHGGLVPMTGLHPVTGDPQVDKHGRIVDHARDGLPGLLSIVGVKYTTARGMAERVVDRVFALLGRRAPPSRGAVIPLHGGDPGGVASSPLVGGAAARRDGVHEAALARLVRTHGSAASEVLRHLPRSDAADGALAVLHAEVRHAVHCEMAQTLADVVFRRTDLGTAGDPGDALLDAAAQTAGAELGWTAERARQEIREVHARFNVPR